MTDSTVGEGDMQDQPGASSSTKKWETTPTHTHQPKPNQTNQPKHPKQNTSGGMSKKYRSEIKKLPTVKVEQFEW